jgi:hypothetical protein
MKPWPKILSWQHLLLEISFTSNHELLLMLISFPLHFC